MSDSADGKPAQSGAQVEDRRSQAAAAPRDSSGLLENMFAPELYASFASSFSLSAGSVTIKLVSTRWDNAVEPAAQKAVVVGRITMPLQGAQTLAAGLQDFLRQHGLEYVPVTRPRTRASDAVVSSPNSIKT